MNIPAKNEVNKEEKTNESMIGKIEHLQKEFIFSENIGGEQEIMNDTTRHNQHHEQHPHSMIGTILIIKTTSPFLKCGHWEFLQLS